MKDLDSSAKPQNDKNGIPAAEPSNDSQIEVSITDTGTGISKENLEKVFRVKLVGDPTLKTLLSYMDKNNIERLSDASNIEINPGCVDLPDTIKGRDAENEERNALLYFGALKTLPNRDGIGFFYRKPQRTRSETRQVEKPLNIRNDTKVGRRIF